MFFTGLHEEEELKKRYKELAKQYHPDKGGDTEVMKAIIAKDEKLRSKLQEIIMLPNILIEICGSWLWLTGDTKTHKETLKKCNFFWSNTKGAWYWRAEDKKSFNRKPMALEDIRARYGSFAYRDHKKALA